MSPFLNSLLTLPLMQGVSAQRLADTLAVLKPEFGKPDDGSRVFAAGDVVTHLVFVLEGVCRVDFPETGGVQLSYLAEGPQVYGAENLFGIDTHMPVTVTAVGPVRVMMLSKSDYLKMLKADNVFLFNCLNRLSAFAQRIRHIASAPAVDPMRALAGWVALATPRSAKGVTIRATDDDLARFLHIDKASASKSLEAMIEAGDIKRHGNTIVFTD